MSAAKHTPGPWKLETESRSPDGSELVITDSDGGYTIALCRSATGIPDADEAEANAKLIAAAPALAEALEKAADTLRDAATAYHFFGKHVAAEAMEIAEKYSREVLRAAERVP
jgi:hypothetical protein